MQRTYRRAIDNRLLRCHSRIMEFQREARVRVLVKRSPQRQSRRLQQRRCRRPYLLTWRRIGEPERIFHKVVAASDKQAVAIIQTLLRDQQPQPRLFAAKALAKQPGSVLPLLKNSLHDSEAAVRLTAAGSLLQQIDRLTKSSARRGQKG